MTSLQLDLDIANKIKTHTTEYGTESFIAFESPPGLSFSESLEPLFETYDAILRENLLNEESEIMLRFHLSDITNQKDELESLLRFRNRNCLISMVGQPPASRSKVALEAYHIKSITPINKRLFCHNALSVQHSEYNSIWTRCRPQYVGPSYQQTQQIFGQLSTLMRVHHAKIEDHLIRTWIYVRDVDNNYQGMVDARRELFELVGLSKATHYIASTGIDGCGETVSDLVLMDALAVTGLDPSQITYMSATDFLCPTYEYNVTFERATRVMFGDRSHYYISGTASIDHEGNILHVGNVVKQADRTLINIQALLNNYGASLDDMQILIVYLRDVSDREIVESFLQSVLPPGLPYIIVRGCVCRPLWLIEMEGIAVSNISNKNFAPFC